MTGKLAKVYYHRRTRVPRWWPFSWPPKWEDSHMSCDNISLAPLPLGSWVDCGDNLVFASEGKIRVRNPYDGSTQEFDRLDIYQ